MKSNQQIGQQKLSLKKTTVSRLSNESMMSLNTGAALQGVTGNDDTFLPHTKIPTCIPDLPSLTTITAGETICICH
jgi:hypothetical protein